ncbi:MAG TPA: hypothetical protein VGW36_01840, partial [Pyrinomonadaceae bacterium]|nr:hypothetical protein [Pyrinomonadaceae bacterium]
MRIETPLVFLVLIAAVVATGCQQIPATTKARAISDEAAQRAPKKAVSKSDGVYGPPTKLAELEDKAIDESSGLAASRTSPGCYWTHNDSGNGPIIYAFDSGGRRRGTWRVTGAKSDDWEDIAVGPGPKPNQSYLYIGDIGDNTGNRSEIVVYRIPEPVIPQSDSSSTSARPQPTEPAEAIRLRYPDGKHDSEALLVHPQTGKIYLVTKEVPFINPSIYAAVILQDLFRPVTLTSLGQLEMPGLLGGT